MNAVLVDTSVWVDHFQRHNESLVDLLSLDLALSHPMIVAELACGTPPVPLAYSGRYRSAATSTTG
jgi:predicted nucleic acid-binding protein